MAPNIHNDEVIPLLEAHTEGKQQVAQRWPAAVKTKVNRRIYDFVWIVYSFFWFIEPINRNNRHFWMVFLGFYAIFVAIYCGMVLTRTKRHAYILYIALGVLGMAYYPRIETSISVFIFIAAFAPFTFDSVRTVIAIWAALCSIATLEGVLLHASPWSWGMASAFSILIGAANLVTAQRVRANAKLELAHEEIEQLAKLAERERIARDLHDVLGHTLSVIVLKSELAGRLFERDPQRARLEIAEVEQVSRKALSEVREAIRGYRSEGLVAEIERAHRTLNAAGVILTCESKPPSLAPTEETVLSLAVREAVTNIVRHAQASECRMRFVTENGCYSLTVEDDGRGNIRQEGNGLRGMRERIEALGGRFSIDGTQGTRLNINLPIRST